MVKITKSNPNSKRKGVKKESMPYLTIFQRLKLITPDGYEFLLGASARPLTRNPQRVE